jgi:hypothetical protein
MGLLRGSLRAAAAASTAEVEFLESVNKESDGDQGGEQDDEHPAYPNRHMTQGELNLMSHLLKLLAQPCRSW